MAAMLMAVHRDAYSISGGLQPDLKEVIGTLLRAIGGAEITEQEVLDLGFDAEGELGVVLNDAFLQLLQFAQDQDLRRADIEVDHKQRSDLQSCLDRIVRVHDGDRR